MPSRESQTDRQRIDVAGPTGLGDAVAAARRYAIDQGLLDRDRARLCIVVEELIANLYEHGFCETEREISLELGRLPSSISVAIEDNGSPFDPRTAPDVDQLSVTGAGAGLRLVGAWSEIVGYQSSNGRNRLELELALTEGRDGHRAAQSDQ
jgi:anti-sigma regulatory factor (Ser/Thr protein kinase)